MSTIMVVDDMSIFREPIAATLRLEGFDTLCACNGREALVLLSEKRPDLILLDVAMPDMDGIAFLRVLRANPQVRDTPVILLTAVAERDYVMRAAHLGAQDYLLKSQFSLSEMIARVRRRLDEPAPEPVNSGANMIPEARSANDESSDQAATLAHSHSSDTRPSKAAQSPKTTSFTRRIETVSALSQLQPVIAKQDLIRLVNEGLELRPLAPIVQNVMAATASPHCSAEDVARAVSQDQALCIRILKLANGSVYSRGRSVDSIKAAVGRLGSREVRNLVMTLGVVQQYEGRISEHVDARLFWEHSIACGLLASAIAQKCGTQENESLFLWGLLHDIGRLILLEHVPDKYVQAWEIAGKLGLPLEAVETKLMVLDHCHVLERALEHWRFPREFILPVVSHHQAAASLRRLGHAHVEAAATVALANRLTHALLLGTSGNEVIYPLDDLVEMLGIQPEAIQQLVQTVPDETNNLKFSLLARASEKGWPELPRIVRDRLPTDCRPLCVSPEPALDPCRMLVERTIGTDTGESANLGLVYLPDARKQAAVLMQYAEEEQKAGGVKLPLIIVCDKGQVSTDDPITASRPYRLLRMPLCLDLLIETIQALLVPS